MIQTSATSDDDFPACTNDTAGPHVPVEGPSSLWRITGTQRLPLALQRCFNSNVLWYIGKNCPCAPTIAKVSASWLKYPNKGNVEHAVRTVWVNIWRLITKNIYVSNGSSTFLSILGNDELNDGGEEKHDLYNTVNGDGSPRHAVQQGGDLKIKKLMSSIYCVAILNYR